MITAIPPLLIHGSEVRKYCLTVLACICVCFNVVA